MNFDFSVRGYHYAFVQMVSSNLGSVWSVLNNLGGSAGNLQCTEIERKVDGCPVVDGADIPLVAAAAGYCYVFAEFAVQRYCFIPHYGELGNESRTVGILFIMGRRVKKKKKL